MSTVMSGAAEHVLVRTTTAGKPLAVERQGREWQVRAEPVRWFERVSWWDVHRRMPRGQGCVDVEVWQVQAKLGRSAREIS
ncbi:MAG: hypothetical protein HIU81_04645 [Acidobacteria bacterium]|nr:hypothetical protein [Acidobacteriota bacterium]